MTVRKKRIDKAIREAKILYDNINGKYRMYEAIRKAKRRYDYHCICTGMYINDINDNGNRLDGSHIMPAGRTRYSKLKYNVLNILPMIDYIHFDFEWIIPNIKKRIVRDRIAWLALKIHSDYRERVLNQMRELVTYAQMNEIDTSEII